METTRYDREVAGMEPDVQAAYIKVSNQLTNHGPYVVGPFTHAVAKQAALMATDDISSRTIGAALRVLADDLMRAAERIEPADPLIRTVSIAYTLPEPVNQPEAAVRAFLDHVTNQSETVLYALTSDEGDIDYEYIHPPEDHEYVLSEEKAPVPAAS